VKFFAASKSGGPGVRSQDAGACEKCWECWARRPGSDAFMAAYGAALADPPRTEIAARRRALGTSEQRAE